MDNIESAILSTARDAFIENGYINTSMSDIAARVGINRPTLHYYFRTKDKLFQSVFGEIILAVIPKIREIVIQQDKPLEERIGEIVDAYYEVLYNYPSFPLFMIREIQRDVDHLISTIKETHMEETMIQVILSIRKEMKEGHLNELPLHMVFYNFYGLLIIPFATQNLSKKLLLNNHEDFSNMLKEWRQTIVMQMTALLKPKN